MSSVAEPKAPPVNRRGLTVKEYGGLKSTLCVYRPGCDGSSVKSKSWPRMVN